MKFYYTFPDLKPSVFALNQVNAILPEYFSFREEDGQLLLVIELPYHLTDEQAFMKVQRECDRLFFLTGTQLSPKLERKEDADGSVNVFSRFSVDSYLVKELTPDIDRQQWHSSLSLQLRLWHLAQSPELPIASQINLLFQIIEITCPDTGELSHYPIYSNPDIPPHPRTEAKLLRDLSSHGKKIMNSPQVKHYCEHIGISNESHDPTDINFIQILNENLKTVRKEAEDVINEAISRKPL